MNLTYLIIQMCFYNMFIHKYFSNPKHVCFSRYLQVTEGVSEFKPTPPENREFCKNSYSVPNTLLVVLNCTFRLTSVLVYHLLIFHAHTVGEIQRWRYWWYRHNWGHLDTSGRINWWTNKEGHTVRNTSNSMHTGTAGHTFHLKLHDGSYADIQNSVYSCRLILLVHLPPIVSTWCYQ
jgi:hypothetical protein